MRWDQKGRDLSVEVVSLLFWHEAHAQHVLTCCPNIHGEWVVHCLCIESFGVEVCKGGGAWETFLASGTIRHIHRRSPDRVCCTSPQATLRGSALYVSCGTLFHPFATKRSVKLTTCSGAPLPCLPCICCLIQTGHPQPSCYSGPSVLWVSLPGPTGCPPMPRQDGIGDSANPYLLHCCTAALLLHC